MELLIHSYLHNGISYARKNDIFILDQAPGLTADGTDLMGHAVALVHHGVFSLWECEPAIYSLRLIDAYMRR